MYLSKLILNPRCREARRDMASPYELHRTLARAFDTEPGTDYRARHGVLFRVEPPAHGTAFAAILVQSATTPQWQKLPEAYFLNGSQPETKILAPVFSAGQVLGFRLVANPTRKEKREGRDQGRRVALLDTARNPEEQSTPARDWLARQGESHGFHASYVSTSDFWLSSGETRKNGACLYGVRFEGILQVTDGIRLHQAFQTGIGPGKSFGFGLFSLARIS